MILEMDRFALELKIRIAVVDDHQMFRKGLIRMLNEHEEINVVLEAENGRDFIDQLATKEVDVVILDLSMPVLDGWQTLKILQHDFPSIRKIILTVYADLPIADLIKLGVNGYLKKSTEFNNVVDAIFAAKYDGFFSENRATIDKSVVLYEKSFSEENTEKFIFNPRQYQILTMICDGKTSQEIANMINLSKSSIDAIRSEALKVFNARNTTELLRKCILLNIYNPRSDETIKEEEIQLLLQRKERRKLRYNKV